MTSIANGWSDFFSGIFQGGELNAEIRRLKAFEQVAELYNGQVQRLEEEVARLRRLNQLPETPGKTRVPAAVVGYFPLEARATLGVGTRKGIKKGMAVIASEGLVGIVQTADAGSCQVLLISSAQLRLTGMVQRNPPPVGFIRGLSDGAMVFEVLDAKSLVQNGDLVVTSGYSDWIPGGIAIGQVVQIEEDVAFGTRRCQIYPRVQIGSIREVYVLK